MTPSSTPDSAKWIISESAPVGWRFVGRGFSVEIGFAGASETSASSACSPGATTGSACPISIDWGSALPGAAEAVGSNCAPARCKQPPASGRQARVNPSPSFSRIRLFIHTLERLGTIASPLIRSTQIKDELFMLCHTRGGVKLSSCNQEKKRKTT